ncbi:MAG: BLUF domain-containing protein [Bacteroidota bacterium]
MYYLIYVSQAAQTPNDEDIKELVKTSEANNSAVEISGMLIYLDGKYLQILEGAKRDVQNLYDKIAKDRRHKQVRVLIEGDIEKRNFENWTMGFKMLGRQNFKELSGFTDLDEFFNQKNFSEESHVALVFLRLFYQKNNRDFAQG